MRCTQPVICRRVCGNCCWPCARQVRRPPNRPDKGCSNSVQFNRARRRPGLQRFIHRPTHVFCGQIFPCKEGLIARRPNNGRPPVATHCDAISPVHVKTNCSERRSSRATGQPCQTQKSAWRNGTEQTDQNGQQQKATQKQRELAHRNLFNVMLGQTHCRLEADTVTDSGSTKKSGSDAALRVTVVHGNCYIRFHSRLKRLRGPCGRADPGRHAGNPSHSGPWTGFLR